MKTKEPNLENSINMYELLPKNRENIGHILLRCPQELFDENLSLKIENINCFTYERNWRNFVHVRYWKDMWKAHLKKIITSDSQFSKKKMNLLERIYQIPPRVTKDMKSKTHLYLLNKSQIRKCSTNDELMKEYNKHYTLIKEEKEKIKGRILSTYTDFDNSYDAFSSFPL